MARRIKILSDFDGVWTNQRFEAADLLRHLVEQLAALTGQGVASVRNDVDRFTDAMRSAPHEHGWAPDGRISAYVDEDPLCESSALCRFLELSDLPRAQAYRRAVLGAYESLAAFSEVCFREATEAFRRMHPPSIVPRAREHMLAILEVGADVVVVSNSDADKLATWLRAAGIDAGEGEGHRVRLRGAAAKWYLGPTDEAIEVGGRRVHVDRPRYRAAIEAERPDLIIGDVFSLDLALPHVMRRASHPCAPFRLALRRHEHTPAWVLADRAGGAIDHVVDGVQELPALVAALRRE